MFFASEISCKRMEKDEPNCEKSLVRKGRKEKTFGRMEGTLCWMLRIQAPSNCLELCAAMLNTFNGHSFWYLFISGKSELKELVKSKRKTRRRNWPEKRTQKKLKHSFGLCCRRDVLLLLRPGNSFFTFLLHNFSFFFVGIFESAFLG